MKEVHSNHVPEHYEEDKKFLLKIIGKLIFFIFVLVGLYSLVALVAGL